MKRFAVAFAVAACGAAGCTETPLVTCPATLAPAGVRLSLGDSTLAADDSAGTRGAIAVRNGEVLGGIAVTWLDARGVALAQPSSACSEWTIATRVGDSLVATAPVDASGKWRLSVAGHEPGATTLQVCLLHNGTVVFESSDVPVSISPEASHVPAAVSAAQVVRNGATLATWNYDAALSPDLATGALVTWQDSTTGECEAQFLDAGRGAVVPSSPLYAARVLVKDPAIAEILPVPGNPWRFRVHGLRAGSTAVWLEMRYGQRSEYVSGLLPLIVAPPTLRETSANCVFKRNGVWNVTVRNGALVSGCDIHVTDPGYLQAPLGTLSEHFKFQTVSDACVPLTPSDPGDAIVFDIADPGVAHVLTHPAHDFGERFSWHFEGVAAGRTTARVWYIHNGGVAMVTPQIPLVTEVVQ